MECDKKRGKKVKETGAKPEPVECGKKRGKNPTETEAKPEPIKRGRPPSKAVDAASNASGSNLKKPKPSKPKADDPEQHPQKPKPSKPKGDDPEQPPETESKGQEDLFGLLDGGDGNADQRQGPLPEEPQEPHGVDLQQGQANESASDPTPPPRPRGAPSLAEDDPSTPKDWLATGFLLD